MEESQVLTGPCDKDITANGYGVNVLQVRVLAEGLSQSDHSPKRRVQVDQLPTTSPSTLTQPYSTSWIGPQVPAHALVASSVRRQVSVACTAVANPAARTMKSVAWPGRVIEQP